PGALPEAGVVVRVFGAQRRGCAALLPGCTSLSPGRSTFHGSGWHAVGTAVCLSAVPPRTPLASQGSRLAATPRFSSMLNARLLRLDDQAHEHAHDHHQLVLSLSGRAEFEVN